MSLQQNIETLYDNILSAKLWAALSNEVKQQLIRDPAAINHMRYDPMRIAQQAAAGDQQIQLSEAQAKAILNSPPCPFKLTSLKKFFLENVPNGEEAFKELRKQTVAETERYLTKELTPMLSQDDIYDILEHPNNRYGLEGVQNHEGDPLPRYSSSERKQRRAASAAVRKAHIQLADWAENALPELPQLHRAYGALYMPEYADTRYVTYNGTLKERNEEIGWLFNPDSERYKKEKNDLVIKLGPNFGDGSLQARAQAVEEQFAKRRGELVMERLKDFQKIYNNLDTITDPSLPAAELEKNFLRIERASNMVPDVTTYLADVNSGFIAVSEADKATMAAFQPNSVSSALLTARAKLQLIANPLYEYLDINTMNGYNMNDIRNAYYGSDHDMLEPSWRQGKTDLKPEFKNYAHGVADSFTVMLIDECNHIAQQGLAMEQMRKDILDRFSFQDQNFTHYQENYSDEVKRPDRPDEKVVKHPDKPHAFQQGDRVVIIQQKTPADTLSIMHPEAMYNQSLKGNNALHLRTLLATDPWYMINHGEFRELKSALQKVNDLAPLKANFTQQDIDKATRRFERLEKASRAYMERKERDRQGRTDKKLKEREIQRVEEAKKIQAYAKFKLKELQLVHDAKATLEKYKDKSLAEIKAITTAENDSPAMKSQIHLKDASERMENPGAWLKRLYANATLPKKLGEYLNINVGALRINYKFNNWLNEGVVDKQDLVQKAAGSTIAAQLVLQERWDRKAAGMDPAAKGPIETYFSDTKKVKECIDKLGTAAMNQHIMEHGSEIPKDRNGEYNSVYLANSFLNHFDPRNNLDLYRDLIQPSATLYPTELKYLNAIQAVRNGGTNHAKFQKFTQNAIIEPARQCADPNRKVSQQALDTLLSNTMVYGMIQEDRLNIPQNANESLEPLLSSSYQLEQLRTWVAQSDVYQAVRNSCLGDDGQLSSKKVLDTIQNGIPKETVQNCKASCRESLAAWHSHKENAPAIRAKLQNQVEQIEQNNRKKLKLEDAQPKARSKEAPRPKAPQLS